MKWSTYRRSEKIKAMIAEFREAQTKGYRVTKLKRGRKIITLVSREERSIML